MGFNTAAASLAMRSQPGKLLMIDDEPQQLGSDLRRLRVFVGAALAAKQGGVQHHQPSAEITQAFAAFVH